MIDENVVSRAKEYLDRRFAEDKEATLVGMLWYIDTHDKMIPLLNEVNEALRQHASAFVLRAEGIVNLTSAGRDRDITADELEQAIITYREEFAAALQKLESEIPRN